MPLRMQYYNNPILRKCCRSVEKFDAKLHSFVEEMITLAKEHDTTKSYSAGLAAPQAGKPLRVFIIRLCEFDPQGKMIILDPKVYINPVLTNPSKETEIGAEGCLSLPGLHLDIERPVSVTVKAQDIEGNFFTEEISGFHARVVMHENDHINGKLFIDRISKQERKRIKEDLERLKKKYPQS